MSTPLDTRRMLFIPEVEAFGGAERSVLALSRWLHDHGIDNYLLSYDDRVGLEKFVAHPLEVVQLKAGRGARNKVRSLKAHMRTREDKNLLCSGYQPAMHATLAGVRGFQTLMHDTPSLFGDKDTRTLSRKARLALSSKIVSIGLRSGGSTIVTSEYLKSECRRDFNIEAKIARMGGTGSSEEFRERPVTGTLNLLSVCRIEPNKRIDWMLTGLHALESGPVPLSQRCDWHLKLAGKGSQLEAMEARAKQLGLADRVQFLGFVSDEQLHELYEEASLFLMPAVQGFGIPAVEALQVGLPVLLHRESGVSDILRETPWATVLYGGEENMAAALEQAIDGVLEGRHFGKPLPPISSEDQWAEQVARYCGWV